MTQKNVAYSLSTSIMANNNCQRRIEFNDLNMFIVEGTDTPNRKLVQRRPMMSARRHRFDGEYTS
jgi:hypothetical protein